HAGQLACAENGQCRGRCRAREKTTSRLRLYRHYFHPWGPAISKPFPSTRKRSRMLWTPVQYPVQRDALQHQVLTMVTVGGHALTRVPSVVGMVDASAPILL